MFDRILRYLSRIGIDFDVLHEGQALDFEIKAAQGRWNCLLSVHGQSGIGVYSTILTPVPNKKRLQMAAFLMYLNNGQLFGNFELDLKTGDVRFKTYLDCEALELTESLIDRTMLLNVSTMQRHYTSIMKLIQAA